MKRLVLKNVLLAGFAIVAMTAAAFPDPPPESGAGATHPGLEKVVLAGGCFWGIEAVFESLRGVTRAVSGYSGGNKATAHYEMVSTGMTGHAESVEVTYDPSKISFGELLKVFFSVAHDPTQLNRQGPDEGTQYRSVIFYATPEQKRTAEDYIRKLTTEKTFRAPIVTQVVPLVAFYPAESYHQHFAARNPNDPYIVYNDKPKLDALHAQYPQLIKPGS
ncbi:MAG: peptide-methionine (S)-S-oxide reductase MsrA [Candidatus Eremiobacteraeota bacterium]|nr:peptide-methionine (S)-S-oxide reductase MsrA [Candidatus Eremiobacteraeota bacterium]